MVRIILLLCAISESDRAWIETAVEAWRVTSAEALHLPAAPMPQMILFDDTCTSDGKKHGGTIVLPDGEEIPAQVTSFAASHDGKPFFVMALPSLWRKVPRHAEDPALDRLTRVVFVHEMTHTVQSESLGSRIGALIEKYKLPNDAVDDDIVQDRFGKDPGHVAAYEKERDLFYEAAAANEAGERRRLLASALAAMRDRRARFLSGDNAVYAQLEDVFLMMEGTANWAAMKNAARDMPESDAIAYIRGRRHRWTQDEGLGIFLAIDATTTGWQERVLGDAPPSLETLIENAASGVR